MAAQDYRLCRMASAGFLTVLFSVILHLANAAVVPAALGSRASGWALSWHGFKSAELQE